MYIDILSVNVVIIIKALLCLKYIYHYVILQHPIYEQVLLYTCIMCTVNIRQSIYVYIMKPPAIRHQGAII